MKSTGASCWLTAAGILLVPGLGTAFFEAPEVISSTGRPAMVVGGDFDGDGVVDLAVAAQDVGRVMIFSGRGDGTFRFPRGLDAGGHPTALATGDLDRNGRLDVVWIDEPSGDVGVILQMPTLPTSYDITVHAGADEPQDLLVIDVDGDEWPDVVTANHGADLVSVYPNLGGTLGAPQRWDVGDGPAALAALGGAGGLQLAVVQTGALSTDVGLYAASFEPVQLLSIQDPAGITALDWNGDALTDVAITDRAGRGHVYTSGASGLLTSQASWSLAEGASAVAPLRTSAGDPGVIVLEKDRNRVVLSARAVGGAVENLAGYFVGENAGRFLWLDLDSDEMEELVVPLPEEEILLLVRRNGDRLRGFPSVLTGQFPRQVEVVDAAPGVPPRAAVLCPPSQDLWLYDISGGRLQPSTVLAAPPQARRFRWAFVDSDALPDLVIMDIQDGFWVYLAQGAGFAPAVVVNVAGDFRDVVVLPWGSEAETDILLADGTLGGARIFSADGLGGYAETGFIDCRLAPVVAGVEDLDRDGRLDLITLGSGNTVCFSYNGPTGLDQQTIFTVGDEPRGLVFGDFNGDVYPDVAIGNAGDETFTVMVSILPRIYGLGAQNQVTPSGSQTAEAFDVNQDGRDDLLFTSLADRSVSIHAGLGNGIFTVPTRVRCSSLPFDLAAHDIDGDGRQDLLVLDTLGDALVSLLTSGTTANPVQEPATTVATVGDDATLILAAPYPNPSDGIVHFRLRVKGELVPRAVVYDLRGRRVADLQLRPEQDGWFTARWDGCDAQGQAVARGRYLVQSRAGASRAVRPILLR